MLNPEATPNPFEPAVAAADAATARAGAAILAAGGNAADAAAAAVLASCAAETVFTGLGGGGFATYWDAATGTATAIDFFVAVPGLGFDGTAEPMQALPITLGEQPLDYFIGGASVAVPGVAAGVGALHRGRGRLPWAEVVAPAAAIARAGAPLSPAKAAVLGAVAPALCRHPDGAAAYAPGGELATAGTVIRHRNLDRAYALLAAHGPEVFYTGEVAAATVAAVRAAGGSLTARDLAEYRPVQRVARTAGFAGHTLHGRHDLLDVMGTLSRLPADIGRLDAAQRSVAWVDALLGADNPIGTSNLCVVDRWGNACAVTTSLGLTSTVWAEDYGLQLNNMLGEGELMVGSLQPGDRVPSMMSPLVATRDGGLAAVAGAAGGSRIRSSLVQVLTGVLAEGLSPAQAIDRPRLNPVVADDGKVLVHLEPGQPDGVVRALDARGWQVRQWSAPASYFGGVAAITPGGAAGDPRRDGFVARPGR